MALALALVTAAAAAAPALARSDEQPTTGGVFLWGNHYEQWGEDGRRISDDVDATPGSMYWVNRNTGAASMWANGYTGDGVDIALIDTGVAPVNGLTTKGKVVNGADLSFDSQIDGMEHLDAYGHGTHLAGIMAGRDDGTYTISKYDNEHFLGVAPDARIVSVKVGDAVGSADVSQVIAAIDWVIEHRYDNGLNVRIINLAYGTDGVQGYEIDPLTHAVERAWDAGIVVVVAAGNDGNWSALRNPAVDPFVIAVGATENTGYAHRSSDDLVTNFSSCGNSTRRPDIVAPGKSIVSLRTPGSVADVENPKARVGDRFFLGSGTSQAAAVVSGAVALLLEQHPGMNPDQVKELLVTTARHLDDASAACQGAGTLNLRWASRSYVPSEWSARQDHPHATGTGSLEKARGTMHVYARSENAKDMVALEGEMDIMGRPWNGYKCEKNLCASLWNGGTFNGASWSGASWGGASWSGASWSGASWGGASWSGASWSGASWGGASWSGASWSGASWSGASWSGASWSCMMWSGKDWR